jgi:hypothetical protein
MRFVSQNETELNSTYPAFTRPWRGYTSTASKPGSTQVNPMKVVVYQGDDGF